MKNDLAEAVFQTTAALIVVLDPEGGIVRFNAACERLTGHKEADIIGQLIWPLVKAPPHAAHAASVFAQLTSGHPALNHEDDWLSARGEHHYISWVTTHLLDASGKLELIVATGLDVTEARAARLEREESETRFRALFERSGDGVVLMDPHDLLVPWRIVDCNATFTRMNGYAREELIGMSIDLVQEDDLMAREGTQLLAWIREQGESAHSEGTHRHWDGHVFPVESSTSIIMVGGRELVLGIDRDVTERKRTEAQLQALNEKLAHDAHHDALTGLPNRALLYDQLTVELARVKRSQKLLAVLFVDLDEFKRVNDTLGHASGDHLLKEFAHRLQMSVRPSDLVARMGGDEFVVVVPDLSCDHDMLGVVERIRTALGVPFNLNGLELMVHASIGITMSPADGGTADTLLSQADAAMYHVKRGGKNKVLLP